ncbi:hypothetical protein N7494_008058 [Penicillium frequentans]|uniref:Subtelomeric hrmA-associated cluster protein AFUB-079030/YDR124W-like helical bundle domain-containing protein n=1 Tax=Penicillium frequentans TaxID=3151616 RepID=A0AAD6CTP4_9EURO|nr:hypothetical protein N7494_008058 [Penicillium glabrum]
MDMSRSHLGVGEALERRHSDTSVPHSHMAVSSMSNNVELPHKHFAVIFLDQDGNPQVMASPSIAGCGGAIFTPDVKNRFMEMTSPISQSLQYSNQASLPHSPWGMQSDLQWGLPSHTGSPEKIPCEWQSQQSRRKRRDMKRIGMVRPRPKSATPPPTPPPGRSVLRVDNADLLRRYYEKAFEDFQQLNCRAIAKSYIKLVEPRKQVHFPYNGRKVIAGVSQRVNPELTKPGWWPQDVQHKEPDHLLKRDRLKLLVHILCELKDSHGVTAEKLREAGQDVRRQISPANRLQVLDEIYFVRQMEERYLDGKIDASTLVQVIHTHLPEANYQATDPAARVHSAPSTSFDTEDDEQDDEDQGPLLEAADQYTLPSHQVVPLSPATSCSESSGPHSPTTGYGAYPISMAPNMIPHESPVIKQQMPDPHAHPHPMSGYYAQPFAPTEKNTAYWPSVPHSMTQYGY